MSFLFQLFLSLFTLNTVAILLLARAGWRGRAVVWAVQADVVWLWLLVVSLAGIGIQRVV